MPFPSAEQQRVIDHRTLPLVVVAGPGSGKTRMLVERMIALLRDDPNRNVSFVTFTRTSRRDTERKLEKALGAETLALGGILVPRVGTLHATAKAILHRFAGLLGREPNFTILLDSKGEVDMLVREAIDDLGLDVGVHELRAALSEFRCSYSWPDGLGIKDDQCQEALDHFNRLLAFYSTFDFDGVVEAASELIDRAGVDLPALFLQVDEFQDLNPADQRFIELISRREGSEVVVVGDDAQSIYGFRHADLMGLHRLWADEAWAKATLSECFRLPSEVLSAALALVGQSKYLGSSLIARPDTTGRIATYRCTQPRYQDIAIARRILELRESITDENGDRLKYKDFMILVPSTNFIPGIVATLQDEHGIPVKQVFRPEIPDDAWSILLVLRMARYRDNLALRHWLERLEFDPDSIADIRREAMASEVTLFSKCESLEDPRIDELLGSLETVSSETSSTDRLARALSAVPGMSAHQQDLADLLEVIVGEEGTPESPVAWMQRIGERFGIAESESDISEDDRVLVSTLHSAKGLEAECVFISWMNAQYMPMTGRDMEEERRVLYVGMTRAKRVLGFAFHEKYDPVKKRRLREEAMSPFLRGISDHLDVQHITAASLM